MKKIYEDYARYNLWANKILVDFFAQLPESQFEQEIVNSFPSIRKTLLHIWDGEQIWLTRLKGGSMNYFPSSRKNFSNDELLKGLLATSKELHELVEGKEESFFESVLSFNTTEGNAKSQIAHKMLHQVLNHGTYHRGQLIMMAKQLNLKEVPSTDYILYIRNP